MVVNGKVILNRPGSWIIVSRETGKPVLETFSQAVADHVNRDAYIVMTAHEWLVEFNRKIKAGEV